MKISHHWLTHYLDLHQSPQRVAEYLTQIGLEVAHITPYEGLPEELLIGKVGRCIPHPNADQLRLATVDIGEKTPKSIVCGAPNLAVGQKVVVAPIGTRLKLPTGEDFLIKARKIRGEVSEGMICSAPEIGLQGDASGIWVLPPNAPIGQPLAKYLKVSPDTIYDIELTPNRNDACSHFGVARDLAALLHKKIKPLASFTLIPTLSRSIEAQTQIPQVCRRYTGLVIENVKVGPSPAWLQHALKSIGVKPICNVVDITNYITHALGQPLHAFDYQKIAGKKIRIRKCDKGTPFTPLDGVQRYLTGEEVMICDTRKPLALAGIMGGITSAITATTCSIFLESAYFDPIAITRAARHHQLHTDASYRFERGTDPEMCYTALQRAAQMMVEIAGGEIASTPLDLYEEPITPITLELTYAYIDEVIGVSIPRDTIDHILERLDITIQEKHDETLTLSIPPYRRDVTRPIDVVEEILRLYGYNHKSLRSPKLRPYPVPPPQEKIQKTQQELLQFLPTQGYWEIKNLPFIPAIYHDWIEDIDPKKSVTLTNPLHAGEDTLPQTLLFGGLRTIAHNIHRQQKDLRFFEISKTYHYGKEGVKEIPHLALWATGATAPLIWKEAQKPFTLQDLQATLIQLLDSFGYPTPTLQTVEKKEYAVATQLQWPDEKTITCGEVAPRILQALQIDQPVFFAQLPLSLWHERPTTRYQEVPKYPYVTRDISVAFAQDVVYATVEKALHQLKIPQLRDFYLIDCYQGKSVGDQKSYTLRFVLQDRKATLQEKKITAMMDKISRLFTDKLGATIRE